MQSEDANVGKYTGLHETEKITQASLKGTNDDLCKLTLSGEKCNRDDDTINTSKDNDFKENCKRPCGKCLMP